MKGMLKGVAALAMVAALAASPAQAQSSMPVSFGAYGGLALPLGDFGDAFKTGFDLGALVAFNPANLPVGFRVDGTWQQNKVDADADIKSRMIYGTADVVYTFQTAPSSMFHPYLIGGVGMYNGKSTGDDVPAGFDESTTKFGVNAGAGFNFTSGSNVGFFVEGRFHSVFTEGSHTNFIPINVGIRFGGK